jgi:hypothetical protein
MSTVTPAGMMKGRGEAGGEREKGIERERKKEDDEGRMMLKQQYFFPYSVGCKERR